MSNDESATPEELAKLDAALEGTASESKRTKHERHQDMLAEHAEVRVRRREAHRAGRRKYIPIHLI